MKRPATSEAMKEHWADPDVRARRRLNVKRRRQDPEARARRRLDAQRRRLEGYVADARARGHEMAAANWQAQLDRLNKENR